MWKGINVLKKCEMFSSYNSANTTSDGLDEWTSLANFILELIEKYAIVLDKEQL